MLDAAGFTCPWQYDPFQDVIGRKFSPAVDDSAMRAFSGLEMAMPFPPAFREFKSISSTANSRVVAMAAAFQQGGHGAYCARMPIKLVLGVNQVS